MTFTKARFFTCLYTTIHLAALTLIPECSGQLSCTLGWGQGHNSQGSFRLADLIGQFMKQQEMEPGFHSVLHVNVVHSAKPKVQLNHNTLNQNSVFLLSKSTKESHSSSWNFTNTDVAVIKTNWLKGKAYL